MRALLGALAVTVVVGLVPAAPAAAQTRDQSALADQVLTGAGAARQIEWLERSVQSRMRDARTGLDGEAQTLFDRFMAQSLKRDALYAAVRARFRENVDRDRAAGTLAWFRSPVGRKIAGLEARAAAPEAAAALKEFEAELETKAATSERFVLVNRVTEALNQPDFLFDLVRALLGGLGKGLDRLKAGDSVARLGEAEPAVSGLLTQSRAAVDQATFVYFLFAYRNARDTELDQYARFLRSDDGRWFTRTFQQSLVSALEASGEKAVGELARSAPATPKR